MHFPIYRITILFFIFLLTLPFTCMATSTTTASADSPMKIIENGYNELISVLNDPAYQGEAAREKRSEKLTELAKKIFDFKKISLLALGRNARKFTKTEFEEFAEIFGKLLENTYLARIDTYKDAKIKFDKERLLTPKKAVVDTTVTYNGKEIPITYRLYKKGGAWRGYDVLVEGISLIKNYRTQFNELLRKEKPAEVINLVKKKLDEQSSIQASKEQKQG